MQNKPCITASAAMVPGITSIQSISPALGLSQHCLTVTRLVLAQPTAEHIMIKQE